jgi:hypothetical protein
MPFQVSKRCQRSGVRKHRHSPGNFRLQASSSSLILIGRPQSVSAILAEKRPSSIDRHHLPWSSAKVVLDRPPWSSPLSSSGDIGGTISSMGGAPGGPPPSSTGDSNRATSSSVSSCNKALGAPSTKKRRLD